MTAEQYFLELSKSIKNLASKADLFLFDGPLSVKSRDEIFEDCLVVFCFFTSFFREKPPFLLEFIERDFKDKETKEMRKQLGAFFTPPYIAEYICKNTLDKLMENKTVNEVLDLKICDPALGGGIFLVCAHDHLMEKLIQINTNLPIEELALKSMHCLFGVDINPKAVEFSKMILNANYAKWCSIKKIDEYVLFVQKNSI